jgi:GntR family transcriptional regulator
MVTTALQRNLPLQEQLRQILTERVTSGQYAPGSDFPSETELAQEFDLSRATVRSALSGLVAEGLLVRRQGIGTSVSQRPSIADPIGEALDFRELIGASGFEASIGIHLACLVTADACQAADLQVARSSELLQLELVLSADGSPVIYCLNHIPTWLLGADLVAELVADPATSEPIYEFLEQRCNQTIDYHLASLWADLPQNFDIAIPDGDQAGPMLIMKSIAFNTDGRPIFRSQSAYPDPRIKFTLMRRHKRGS